MTVETRSGGRGLQVRSVSGSDGLTLTGYASVTGTPYQVTDWLGSYQETVQRGAFGPALATGPDVKLLANHDGLPLARTASGTLTLREITFPGADPLGQGLTGLWVRSDLDPANPLVQQIRSAMTRGDLSEMSFAFTVDDAGQSWNTDYTQRSINEIGALFDVSLVTYPANPATVATLG